MQVPIVNGIYTDAGPDFRTSYPVNMVPVPKQQGISQGYLRPGDGVIQNGTYSGWSGGGLNWNGVLYRVMGGYLIKVNEDGSTVEIGRLGPAGLRCTITYSFDYLAVAYRETLWLYDGTTLTQVTDADLGTVLDVLWVDGYFMTHDGTSLVVTELNNPFSVNPLKYGSSEVDPDPVVAIVKVRNEVYALNRYTVEVFQNIGGTLFPFQRVPGAQMMRGCIGVHACAVFMDALAFLGSGKDEEPTIYMGANGQTVPIATRAIDEILGEYTEEQLATAVFETRMGKKHQQLYIYLPRHTVVYDGAATAALGQPVWFQMSTSLTATGEWKARDMVWCYNRWNVAHPTEGLLGFLTNETSAHWGERVGWEFGTPIMYAEGQGAIFHELELVTLPGRVAFGTDPVVRTSYSFDGITWSQKKAVKAGKTGERTKRLRWLSQGTMKHWRVQRFQGDSNAHISCVRLEARIEPLAF